MFDIDDESDFEKKTQAFQKLIDKKDLVYLNKVITSIKKVIHHFEHDVSSFEDLTPEFMLKCNKHSDISYVMRASMEPDYKPTKHTFSLNKLGTFSIYMPTIFSDLFSRYNSKNSCDVLFKENGDLKGIQFKSNIRAKHSKTIILTYDNNLKLSCISRSYMTNNTPLIKNLVTTVKSYCDDDITELYFLNLFLKDADQLFSVLPEFSIPSAYDFSNETFKDRLLVAEMMLS